MFLYYTFPALHVSDAIYIHPELEARHDVERVNSHVHFHVPAACALYDAPEDGCILHSKHVEQGKCNKVTLNNLHQAGLNKPLLQINSSVTQRFFHLESELNCHYTVIIAEHFNTLFLLCYLSIPPHTACVGHSTVRHGIGKMLANVTSDI